MNYGFVRVAAGVPKLSLANCLENSKEISKMLVDCNQNRVQIVVFPELSITGYTCADLFHQKFLIDKALETVNVLRDATLGIDITAIIGVPIYHVGKLFNCAVIIHGGRILGVVPKTFIPNYGEFYERRWFAGAEDAIYEEIELHGETVPFGADLVFKVGETGAIFGVEICEDLWVPNPPSGKQALAGANILFNLSASNDLIGKYEYRKDLINMQSARCIAAYIYASSSSGESTTDLVFGGHAMISEYGVTLAEAERYSDESQLIIADIDIERLNSERVKNTSFIDLNEDKSFRVVYYKSKDLELDKLRRGVIPHPFVPVDSADLKRRCEDIFAIQTNGLTRRMNASRSKFAVIGISGGLDSTLALLVTVKAFDMLSRDRKDIIAVTMPGFGTTDVTYHNAVALMKSMGVTVREVNIKDACIQHFKDIGHDIEVHDVTYENVQARERTQILMDLANKFGGIVIGTGDLSELALGWCTYNGDHMSMYSVNCSIPKTLVRFLVQWVADNVVDKNTANILKSIIETPISPELLPPNEDGEIKQLTEDVIGPYELHDFFLYHMIRYGATPKKIKYLAKVAFGRKYTERDIEKWLKVFLKRFFSQQFKRSCVPDGPKVGSISLSPRGDWRMPSDVEAKMWLDEL